MSVINCLLTILAILSPVISSLIEPRRWGHSIDSGILTAETVEGFIGERPITGPDGDYFRATHCYCKTALQPDLVPRGQDGRGTAGGNGIQPGEIVQGHIWRYEYFNYHNNATYLMDHLCMEDAFPPDHFGCGYDQPPHFVPVPHGDWTYSKMRTDWAFTYSPIPGHNKHSFVIQKREYDVDWLMYGRGPSSELQKRRLGKDQGLIEMPKEYVDDKCTQFCREELMLPMDETVWSHGELYNDVDDMCDRCA